jgi:hypothetical protein
LIVSSILCVHGIGQQLKGEEIVASEWRMALRDGMRLVGIRESDLPPDSEIVVAFYGNFFRAKTTKSGDRPYELADISPGLEEDLINYWLSATDKFAQRGSLDFENQASKSGWQPGFVQDGAMALLRLPFFAHLTEQLFVGALRQVSLYFQNSQVRQEVQLKLASYLTRDTKLIVAHSFGSVVAYETLCHFQSDNAPAFATLGSPLGIPNLIFDRLEPRPVFGVGHWPGSVPEWINIADRHDMVAAVKRLAPLFGPTVRDVSVENEALAHDVVPYLTAAETGKAFFEILNG